MKKIFTYILVLTIGLVFNACNKILDVQPLDRVPASQLLTDISGVKVLLANLYSRMPVEDLYIIQVLVLTITEQQDLVILNLDLAPLFIQTKQPCQLVQAQDL
jgi:hypothetical protein